MYDAGRSTIWRFGKWALPRSVFRTFKVYPFPYCAGPFVVLPGAVIRPLLDAAHVTPAVWIDDVYVYGMLPDVIGDVTFRHLSGRETQKNFTVVRDCYNRRGVDCSVLAVNNNAMKASRLVALWKALTKAMSDTQKRIFQFLGTT